MLDQVTITILSENRVENPLLIAEPGLSMHISSPEAELLFDTGLRDAFLRNAEQLKIDLAKVEKIMFSHGHYDHTGGLYYYLKKYGKATVICHYNIFNRKFRIIDDVKLEVGIPQEKSELTKLGATFEFHAHPYNFSENILSSGEIPRITDYEVPDEIHQELSLESYITDELHDDMALILKTSKGLIILLGDSHSGPVNTMKHAMNLTGIKEVYAVMGGMNLSEASTKKIEHIVKGFEQINPRYVVPLHSTGFRATNMLYELFRERMLLLNTGDKLTLDL